MSAALIGGLIWYNQRPKPAPNWNEQAVKETFNELTETSGDQVFSSL
jgi:hypothetical protein